MNVNPRAHWFDRLCDMLQAQAEGKDVLNRIPQSLYQKLNDNQRKFMLQKYLILFLKKNKMNYEVKLHCFAHDDRKPSMVFNEYPGNFYCYACRGKAWDIFKIVGRLFQLNGFQQELAKTEELLVERKQKPFSRYQPVQFDPEVTDLLLQRGVTRESMASFGLKVWCWEDGTKYVIIPCDNRFFVRKKMLQGTKDRFESWNERESTVELFNGSRLTEPGVVFIVESALDAILLEQAGFFAVALNGDSPNALNRAIYSRPIPTGLSLIILLDNDPAGCKASKETCKKIQKSGVIFYRFDYDASSGSPQSFLHGFKDVGEAMVVDKAQTIAALDALISNTKS